jgi:hypothetical protein
MYERKATKVKTEWHQATKPLKKKKKKNSYNFECPQKIPIA